MKKLIILVLLMLAVITSLVIRHNKTDLWRNYNFSRKVIESTAHRTFSTIPISGTFDKIAFVNNKLILCNSFSKQSHIVAIYGDNYRLEKKIELPASAVTLISAQSFGNNLHIIDYKKNLYTVGLDSLKLHNSNLNVKNIDRAMMINDSIVLVKQPAKDDKGARVFALYNIRNGRILKSYSVLPNENDYGFNSDGIFTKDDKAIYFKCYLNSRTYKFDAAGKYERSFMEINQVDKHYSVKQSQGNITFSEPTKVLVAAATVNDGRLYVNSYIKANNDKDENEYIDTYSDNGEYLNSIAITRPSSNFPIRDFAITNNNLYILRQGVVEIYKIDLSKAKSFAVK